MSNIPGKNGWYDSLEECPEFSDRSVDISEAPKGQYKNLKSKLLTVDGDFYCGNSHIESLVGVPRVGRHCELAFGNNLITSLEGLNNYECSSVVMDSNLITSLKNVHKHIKRANSIYLRDNPIMDGGIGLILIEDLNFVAYSSNDDGTVFKSALTPYENIVLSDQFTQAMMIITRFLGQGKEGLLRCQEILVDKKLERFAIL